MKKEALDSLKIISLTIAPIVTLLLVITGSFFDLRKDVIVEKEGEIYHQRKLSIYGFILLSLLILSALITISGIYITTLLDNYNANVQYEKDLKNNIERDSILKELAHITELYNKERKITKSIINSVDPIFDAKIALEMSFSKYDDINGITKDTSLFGKPRNSHLIANNHIELILFNSEYSKSRIVDLLNPEVFHDSLEYDPQRLVPHYTYLKGLDTLNRIGVGNSSFNIHFIDYDSEADVIMRWADLGYYIEGKTQLSFRQLEDCYFLASVQSSNGYKGISRIEIQNKSKTKTFFSWLETIKRKHYTKFSNENEQVYHTILLGKFEVNRIWGLSINQIPLPYKWLSNN